MGPSSAYSEDDAIDEAMIKSPPTKVCLAPATYPPRTGGVAVAAQRLALTLVAAGMDVHVIVAETLPGTSGEVTTEDDGGVRVHRFRHAGMQAAAGVMALRRHIECLDSEIGFDLFHGFFLTAVFPLLGAAARGGRPLIASIRGTDAASLLDQPLLRTTLLPALRRATWITSVNHAYLERVAQEMPVDGRSSVIYNGIEPVKDAACQWRLGARNQGMVGTVGEFRRVKDIPLLIRGYAGVAPGQRRGLLLIGHFTDVQEQAWSRQLIEELGIAGETRQRGPLAPARVRRLLRCMRVYCQSSADEGLPNALLEAAALGVPLVATAVGGMAEVITDGETGLLVPHGDTSALTGALAAVLGDEALALRLSAGARRLATQLSSERERAAWLALYRRLLAGGPPSRASDGWMSARSMGDESR